MRLASRLIREWRADLAQEAVIGLALALLTVASSTSIASANCIPFKSAQTYNASTGAYAYWRTAIYTGSGILHGTFSSGATDHTGTCNQFGTYWLSNKGDPHNIGLYLNLGDGCVAGCPSGSLTIDARSLNSFSRPTEAQMLLVKVPETVNPGAGPNFDFSNTAHDMCDVPRPVITNVFSDGSKKIVTLSIGSMATCAIGGALQEITGWNIRAKASATDPGMLDTYGLRGTLAVTPGSNGSASGTVELDCSNAALDHWVTAQLVTGGAVNHLVGPTTRVSCQSGAAACSGFADGTTCDDGSACTFQDTCQAGACVSGTPVVCTASDQCHTTGTCDAGTGACSNPPRPDGVSCSDGDACTAGDACSGGVCLGTTITAPPEIQNLTASANKTTYSWSAAPNATLYDAVRGELRWLPVGPGAGDEICFDGLAGTTLIDAEFPSAGRGFWYLSRGENVCAIGSFGTQSNGSPRMTTTCP
jgi:hypothetical protein